MTCLDLSKPDLGGDAEVLLNGGENLVAAGAGFFNVTGLQGEPQAFRRGVRLMNRNMAPPYPPVVPQVVIGVVIINSKSDFCLGFHLCDLFQWGRINYVRWYICISIKPSTWRCLT